ncbi:MAG: ribonuclease HII [Deltaproteobacteria bacterium]|nr:ribonuclease HII [Deltaproteobacteria bacterium]MBW1961226.1 ribonuclease HII [Deltaproteobacteria bacterium]MBW2151695.1 ribonuclease HII [Deltaproteobacteria bacterium]
MKPDLWKFEKEVKENGFVRIAGIDEAGRGPLAGPVVSAAVILPPWFPVENIKDSKKLSSENRSALYELIYEHAVSVGTGIVDSPEIDRTNILKAALLSMLIAVENLNPQPDFLLIDGANRISSSLPQKTIIKGDSLSASVAAASIVAKVTRDRLMERYHLDYPQFGFCYHKGYPTKAHLEAIKRHGCCFIHRRTFRGVKQNL